MSSVISIPQNALSSVSSINPVTFPFAASETQASSTVLLDTMSSIVQLYGSCCSTAEKSQNAAYRDQRRGSHHSFRSYPDIELFRTDQSQRQCRLA